MQPRLAELSDYLADRRAAVLSAAESVPRARWTERPADGAWSVAELLEHLARVERGCARLVAKRATEARATGHPAEEATSSVLASLDGRGIEDRARRAIAPERVTPTGTLSGDAALEAITASRREMEEAIAAADGLALESIRHEHPRLGEIDLYQWILFVGQHEARHAAQMTEIAAQLSTPTPAERSAAVSSTTSGR